ncbi:alpha-(1,3)-fucosyltransferase C-like isoform X2 [Physella acuta]|uniref:alpha-(1,3)-fucosyltransferase C-like isoform X2 n=1 Tax=Physella acuta TaxID=109671 RepID=UPI0027DC6713|nr:alpha-(1,3)-fucosyltransferase C-like isoform X2 [Physella acuta]
MRNTNIAKVVSVLLLSVLLLCVFVSSVLNTFVYKTIQNNECKHIRSLDSKFSDVSLSGIHPNMIGGLIASESIIATTVSYNTSLVIYCKESPFVVCNPKNGNNDRNMIGANKTFNIALFYHQSWFFSKKAFNFSLCEFNNCIFNEVVTEKNDVVAIYSILLYGGHVIKEIPARWPHQMYVMMAWESPFLFHGFMEEEGSPWETAYNLSMTYRVDSDVFTPYSKLAFQPQPLADRPNYREIARNKTRSVMWLCGHCLVESKRYEYIKEMRKYIDVDVRGGCGKSCDEKPPCIESLTPTYKFYLSFENSLCQDYVTEKFFKLFNKDIHVVPVVRGKIDYEKYFPENTFINAANFRTAKDLALFLLKLGSDIESYSKYLEHIDLYRETDDYLKTAGCTLCKALNTKKIEPKIYNIKEWFVKGSQCDQNPQDII